MTANEDEANGVHKPFSSPRAGKEPINQPPLSPEAEDQIDELMDRWEREQELGNDLSPHQLVGHDFPYMADLTRKIDRLRGLKWIRKATQSHIGPFWQKGDQPVPGYRLESPLGRGGFGEVWKAIDTNGKSVALKLVAWTEKLAESEWKAVQSIRDLNHPNLIGILGVWRTNMTLVVAMELADTCLWKLWQEARLKGNSALPEEKTKEWFIQAANGIDALHYAKMEHRDIKPSNLLVVNGVLKVADFGLVRLREKSFTTESSALSIAYAAPEFFDGKTSKTSDQYCLAVSWCQVRGGDLPFNGTAAKVVAGHLRKPPDLTMLPPLERPAVARALAKDPKERWDSCSQFVAQIGKTAPKPLLTRRNLLLSGLTTLPVLGYYGYRIGIAKSADQLEILNQVKLPVECNIHRMVKSGYFHPEVSGRLADGQGKEHFAGVSSGNSVLIYRLKTMELVRQIVVGGTACMSFHPLEIPSFYVADNDGGVMAYSLFKKDPLTVYRQNQFDINDLDISFDGRFLYCASCDRNVYKYLTESGKLLETFQGHKELIYCMDISISSNKLLTGGFDGQVILWDLAENKMIASHYIHSSAVYAAKILDFGSEGVTLGLDLKVKLIDLETGKAKMTIATLEAPTASLILMNDQICVSSADGTVRVWNNLGHELLRTQPSVHRLERIAYVSNHNNNDDMSNNIQILALSNNKELLHCQLPKF